MLMLWSAVEKFSLISFDNLLQFSAVLALS